MKQTFFKMAPLNKALKLALLTTVGITSLNMTSVQAAEEANAEEDGNKIVITGSRIKRVDIDGPSPVIVITKSDMDAQGYGTVADVIDGLSQNSGGTLDQSFTFGFTPAASSVNLRGLGFGRTLVLVDGRRMPIYPTGINGTTNFVNLSAIPTAIVDRIDILTGSASAIYGSDAVAGVINVITRKDIEDASIEIRKSVTSEGGAGGTRVNFVGGLTSNNTHVDFIVDYFEQKALWAKDRDYAGSDVADPRGNYSIGGSTFYTNGDFDTIQDPNCGTANDSLGGLGQPDSAGAVITGNEIWCGFDRTAFRQLIAPQRNFSVTSRLEHNFENDMVFNARFGMTRNSVNTQLEPNFYGGGLFTGTGTLVPNNGGFVDAGASNNPTTGTANERGGWFVRRLVEYGPRSSEIDDSSQNALLSLAGTFADDMFDWEVGYMASKSEITNVRPNIILSALNSAVENGLDLFQPIPQDVIDATSFSSVRRSESTLSGLDFSIAGELPFELSGGNVGLALHGELIKETYNDNPDPLTISGQGFDGASAGGGEREHTGLGVEFYLPLLENLSMSAAIRYDDYDDDSTTGGATSPQLSFEYRPSDDVLVRATWGESFRAPDMQRLFGATTRGFQTLNDPFNGGAEIQSVNTLTGSNILLEEETGENWGLGVVWNITDDLYFSADYYDITLENIINTPSAQFILNSCFAGWDGNFNIDADGVQRAGGSGEFCDNIAFDGNGGLQGNAAAISAGATNLSMNSTTGLDLTMDYKWNTNIGDWNTKLSLTYINEFLTQFDADSDVVENVSLGALPETRLNFIQSWNQDDWSATVRVMYIDEIAGTNCTGVGGSCLADEFVDSYTTLNFTTGYDMGDYGRILVGVNNLLAEEPPKDPTTNNWPWFPNGGGYYNAKDREMFVQWNASF